MNFMDKIECTDAEVELKYCERCGGLFLRLLGTSLVYCGGCTAHWAALSTAGGRGDVGSWTRRKPRTPKLHRSKIERGTRIDRLQGSEAIEVRPCCIYQC
jgi:hypothetical protein